MRADEQIGDAARYDLHGDVLGSAHTHTRICFMAAHSRTTSYRPLPLWFSLVNVSAMALWSYTYLIAARISFALADNLADGNPGKRKLAVLDFTDSAADLEGQTMPFSCGPRRCARRPVRLPCCSPPIQRRTQNFCVNRQDEEPIRPFESAKTHAKGRHCGLSF